MIRICGLYIYIIPELTNTARVDVCWLHVQYLNKTTIIFIFRCKKDPNLLSMLYSFKEAFQFMSTGPAPNDLTFKTRSGVFTCRKYQNQGSLFFTTTIGTCSGIRTGANRDQKCVDVSISYNVTNKMG